MKLTLRFLLLLALIFSVTGLHGQIFQVNHVISYLPQTPCAGAPVAFYAMDTTGQFSQSYHYWSFGDNGTGYGSSANPGISHTYSSPGSYNVNFSAFDSLTFMSDSSGIFIIVDSVCANHDMFSGVTYYDLNGNGTKDIGEPISPYRTINIQPGNHFLTSDHNGNWMVNLVPNTYTFTCVSPIYHQLTQPSGGAYTITSGGTGAINGGLDFGIEPIPNMNDLTIYYTGTPPVPGFNRNYTLHYSNVGTSTQTATVSFTYDPSLIFISAANGGTNTGNVITWTVPNVAPGASGMVSCVINIPVNTVIGSSLPFQANIDPTVGDQVPADNAHGRDEIVVASYDPNDKAGLPSGQGPTGDIAPGTPLTYKIRFQNTGTFYATYVVVRDTLDEDLDQSTLEVIGASHPMLWHNDFGKLKFEFNYIMLPDSNTDEPGSHGHIIYRIKPKSTLPLGSELTNTAHIYFDFNAPIVTNTTLHTLANVLSVTEINVSAQVDIAPNPFNGSTMIRFENPQSETHEFVVRDISGKVVRQMRGIQSGQFEFNAEGLPAGMYLYSLENGLGRVAAGKLIVQ